MFLSCPISLPLLFACSPLGTACVAICLVQCVDHASVTCFATGGFQQVWFVGVSSARLFPSLLSTDSVSMHSETHQETLLCTPGDPPLWGGLPYRSEVPLCFFCSDRSKPQPTPSPSGLTLFLLVSCTIKSPLLIVDAFASVACLFWLCLCI